MFEHSVAASPLQGKRILVTRTSQQASVLCEQLRTLGAIPIEFPTIKIVPPADWTQLDAALKCLYQRQGNDQNGLSNERNGYDWLIFTSANGVHMCCERLRQLGYDLQELANVHIATIGPATAAALTQYGLRADLVPDEYIAEGVAFALIAESGQTLQGQRILLARAAEARKVLVTQLEQAGAMVDEVAAYYTVAVARDDEQGREIVHLLQQQQLDILTFTSSSTVRNFMTWLKSYEQTTSTSLMELVSRCHIACIGPITAQTARELGLNVTIEAKEFTIDGLVQAIVAYEGK
jgi:uroporphyrinogen-III synthase